MKRDDEFIRSLLFEFEKNESDRLPIPPMMGGDPAYAKRCHHVDILCDAGLLKEIGQGMFRLTFQGHEYISAIRDETVWKKVKDVANSAGGVTFGIMKEIAVAEIKSRIQQYTGYGL